MPLTHEPEEPRGGPGSAFLSTTLSSKVRRRRRKKNTASSLPQQQQEQQQRQEQKGGFIGKDLLEWQDENVETPSAPPIKPSLKTVNAKKTKRKDAKQTTSSQGDDDKIVGQGSTAAVEAAQRPPHVTPFSFLLAGGMNTTPTSRSAAAATTTFQPRVRHALAVDTRALDTDEGMAIFQNVRQQALAFVTTCTKRGAAPCLLAYSTQQQQQQQRDGLKTTDKSPARGRGVRNSAIQVTTLDSNDVRHALLSSSVAASLESSDCDLLKPISIRPPVNATNVQNRKAVLVPKRLLAHDSWKLFGEFVETVVRQDRQTQQRSNDDSEHGRVALLPPLDVTILTSDVSFLCDTKEQSHKSAATKFWERVRPYFENNAIRSIDIVVAETGCITLSNAVCNQQTKGTATAEDNDDDDGKGDESEQTEEATKEQESTSPNEPEDGTATSTTHKAASAKCLEGIKSGLLTRAEKDFKKTRSCENPPNAVVVKISTISNDRMGYYELLLNWLNKRLALGRDKGTVSFELPENLDGMQCALAFEATYKVFPFRADSMAAAGAMADLRLLGQSKFEVLRLMPLSCVDAHLVFGQAMEICAKLESDLAQYNEMKALVGSVLRYLSEKDVALVLRATDANEGDRTNDLCDALYHTDGQTFLLMGEDLPCRNLMEPTQSQTETDAKTCDLPATGMLVRYAIAEQLLDIRDSKRFQPEGMVDSMKELSEYVESSLDSLESSDANVVFDFAMQQENDSPSKAASTTDETSDMDVSITEDDPWTDNNGVGARVTRAMENNGDKSTDVMSSSDDSFNEAWNAFHYG